METLMVNTKLKIVTRLVAHPEKTESLKALLRVIVEPTGAEKGCINTNYYLRHGEPTDLPSCKNGRHKTP